MAETPDLCRQAFKAINAFKRHRTLANSTTDGKDKLYHELQMYKQFDSIELSVRAINANEKQEEETE